MKSNQTSILVCRSVGKSHGQSVVLKDVSLTLTAGERIGLVGANGSGKTTLLKLIAGLIKQDEGKIVLSKNIKAAYQPQNLLEMGEKKLSEGETLKLALDRIKRIPADIYLLDEPTNNLDIHGLETLERFVLESGKAFIIVSHDRVFLDRTVSRIVELDERSHTSSAYAGNYSAYIEEKSAQIEREWKVYEDKVQKTDSYKTSVGEKIEWQGKIEAKRMGIRKLPMHEKEKPVAAALRDAEGRMGRRARILKDRLEKYMEDTEEIKKPLEARPIDIVFETPTRSGDKVIESKDLVVGVAEKKLAIPDFKATYGERILVKGENGAGKTTLIKALLGLATVLSGEVVIGKSVHIGYLPQDRLLRLEANAKEEFMRLAKTEDQTLTHNTLGKFGLRDEDLKKTLGELSPGEQSRLIIASLVIQKPNCIILDEPTNHIDLGVLTELEEALKEYKGTLIVVSHDRYFIERVGFDREVELAK